MRSAVLAALGVATTQLPVFVQSVSTTGESSTINAFATNSDGTVWYIGDADGAVVASTWTANRRNAVVGSNQDWIIEEMFDNGACFASRNVSNAVTCCSDNYGAATCHNHNVKITGQTMNHTISALAACGPRKLVVATTYSVTDSSTGNTNNYGQLIILDGGSNNLYNSSATFNAPDHHFHQNVTGPIVRVVCTDDNTAYWVSGQTGHLFKQNLNADGSAVGESIKIGTNEVTVDTTTLGQKKLASCKSSTGPYTNAFAALVDDHGTYKLMMYEGPSHDAATTPCHNCDTIAFNSTNCGQLYLARGNSIDFYEVQGDNEWNAVGFIPLLTTSTTAHVVAPFTNKALLGIVEDEFFILDGFTNTILKEYVPTHAPTTYPTQDPTGAPPAAQGAEWVPRHHDPASSTTSNVRAMAVSADTGFVVIADGDDTTTGKIFGSRDGGITWERMYTQDNTQGNFVASEAHDAIFAIDNELHLIAAGNYVCVTTGVAIYCCDTSTPSGLCYTHNPNVDDDDPINLFTYYDSAAAIAACNASSYLFNIGFPIAGSGQYTSTGPSCLLKQFSMEIGYLYTQ